MQRGIVLLALVLCVLPEASGFTSAIFTSRRSTTLKVSNEQRQDDTLTGLTTKMLQAHQEMQQEMKVMEAAQARDRGIATAGEDGIYRIVSEQQYL